MTSEVLDDVLKSSEEKIRDWLDGMLDASIAGDFKTVKNIAKKIRKLAIKDKLEVSN